MYTLNGNYYINLDPFLPIDTIPDIEQALVDSYDLIHQNCWQQTFKLDGSNSNCNWSGDRTAKTTQQFFEIEIKNKTVAPWWLLDITEGGSGIIVYDSLSTPIEDWESISFRKDLPSTWDPMISWFKNMNCFDKLGRICLLITRPGIPIDYHRDSGTKDSEFVYEPHRQEFIWLNMSPEKSVYILDDEKTPIKFDCRSAFFNHHNWHGSHESLPYWSYSFKIEGIFSQEFRERIGIGNLENYDEE